MDTPTDEELVERYLESCHDCHFEILLGRHMARVRSMIYPMVLNDADADDLTQEVFIRVASGLSRFKGRARFTTWLHTIAMNTTRSFLRKRARTPVTPWSDPPETAHKGGDPAEQVGALELDGRIGRALETLSPALRAAVALTILQGMNVRQAARIEGCQTATMYWRVHQARKALKSKLGKAIVE